MNKQFSYLAVIFIGLVLVFGLIFGFWIRKSNVQVDNLKDENRRLTTERGKLTEEVSLLKTRVSQGEQVIKNQRNKIQEINELKEEIERQYMAKVDEAEEYKRLASEREAHIGRLQKRLRETEETLQKEVSLLKTRVSQGEQVIKNQRNKIQEINELKEETERQYMAKVDEAEEYKRLASEREAHIGRLQKRLRETEETLQKTEKKMQVTISDLTSRQQNLLQQLNEAKAYQIRLKQVQATAQKLAEDKNAAERDLKIQEQVVAQMREKQERLLQELTDARAEKIRLNEVIERHQRQAEKSQKRLRELSQTHQDLQLRVKTLLGETNLARAQTEQLATQKVQIGYQLEEVKATAKKLEKAKTKAERTIQIQQQLIKSLKEEIAAGQVKIAQLASGTTIRLRDKIFFDSGKASIKASGLGILTKIGETLKKIQDKHIQVEGHTDTRPIGWKLREKYATNWELSAARAANIVRYLIDEVGIDPTRVSGAGYAFYQPIAPNDTPEGQRQNRRVEFVLIPLRK
ncbi:MAG: OmpA family protein [Candidatus Binatia bacterium]